MGDPIKALAKRERRIARITAERLAESREKSDRAAYRESQAGGSEDLIRISDIPYTPFKG
ncbi:hypothetical protein [Pseudomonas sp. RW3S2]|uniref:hypothetical protein n=1 Tax=Pseudomonas sp. RW3S2 TaxID=485884 RepID=UPI00164561F8|nr:hypothetical protein [Pseudomonas sp. RW3S2]MBC3421823.1 hypothetical protein [Pseudomonas sp. RW3S2]